MKSFLFAALLATTAMSAVFAADAPAAPPMKAGMMGQGGPMKGGMMQGGQGPAGAMRAEMQKDMKALRDKEMKAMDAQRQACTSGVQAATTPEAKEVALKDCRAKAKALRKDFFDQREDIIAKHEDKMDKMRAEMQAKMKANAATQPAAGEAPAK